MPITSKFLSFAQQQFNPYQPESGTEHVAFLLYSLVRMQRPITSVEYGSGYSSLFLLQGLLDNIKDYEEEEKALKMKTVQFGDIENLNFDNPEIKLKYEQWYNDGGKACGVNPHHYLKSNKPVLYSFENCPEEADYVKQMRQAVDELGFSEILKFFPGTSFSAQKFQEQNGGMIDLAWNDGKDYVRFFNDFWPLLNGDGGLMIFHNVSAVKEWWDAIEHIKQHQSSANDVEFLLLEEQHKLKQNSCIIFRKTSDFQPGFIRNSKTSVFQHLKLLMT